jgi:hypothetical protein
MARVGGAPGRIEGQQFLPQTAHCHRHPTLAFESVRSFEWRGMDSSSLGQGRRSARYTSGSFGSDTLYRTSSLSSPSVHQLGLLIRNGLATPTREKRVTLKTGIEWIFGDVVGLIQREGGTSPNSPLRISAAGLRMGREVRWSKWGSSRTS